MSESMTEGKSVGQPLPQPGSATTASRITLAAAQGVVTFTRECVLTVTLVAAVFTLAFSPATFGEFLKRAGIKSVQLPGMTVEMLEQTTKQLEAAKHQVASANHAVSTANQQLKDTEERINRLASSGHVTPEVSGTLTQLGGGLSSSRASLRTSSSGLNTANVKLDSALTRQAVLMREIQTQ